MIENLEIKKLKLLERNPRNISKEQFQKCVDSVDRNPTFLEARPVLVNLVDGQYQVFAGNQRVRAASKLGWKSIPCFVFENLTNEEMQERTILDNVHFGEHDFEILANDYDIDVLLACGFTEKDLELSSDDLDLPETEDTEGAEDHVCPKCKRPME